VKLGLEDSATPNFTPIGAAVEVWAPKKNILPKFQNKNAFEGRISWAIFYKIFTHAALAMRG